jgi:hypothetical protein
MVISDTANYSHDIILFGCCGTITSATPEIFVNSEIFYSASQNPSLRNNMTPTLALNATITVRPMLNKRKENCIIWVIPLK